MNRSKKLETALEGLFSASKEPRAAERAEDITVATAEAHVDRSATQPQVMAPLREESGIADQQEEQVVTFTLGNEYYGVDISNVNSIIKMQYVTPIPRAPRFIEGVTNLRGTVLPVVDLRRRFGMPPMEDDKNARIVVVEMGDTLIGIVVDAVAEVLCVHASGIEPPPPLIITVDSAFITGIAKVDGQEGDSGQLIILLDLDQVLSTEEQVDLKTAWPIRGG